MTNAEFSIAEAVKLGRSLSYCDYLRFLRGLLELCGDSPESHNLRDAVIQIDGGDAQLELIASGQLRLPIDEPEPEGAPRE